MGMYIVMAFCLLKSILDPKLHNFIDVAAFDFQKMTILLSWQMGNVAKSQRHNHADHNFDFHPAIPLRANGLGRR